MTKARQTEKQQRAHNLNVRLNARLVTKIENSKKRVRRRESETDETDKETKQKKRRHPKHSYRLPNTFNKLHSFACHHFVRCVFCYCFRLCHSHAKLLRSCHCQTRHWTWNSNTPEKRAQPASTHTRTQTDKHNRVLFLFDKILTFKSLIRWLAPPFNTPSELRSCERAFAIVSIDKMCK